MSLSRYSKRMGLDVDTCLPLACAYSYLWNPVMSLNAVIIVWLKAFLSFYALHEIFTPLCDLRSMQKSIQATFSLTFSVNVYEDGGRILQVNM